MTTTLVSGFVTGCLYALTALGVVLVYRTSKVINFAVGGMGALTTYLAYVLVNIHVPYGVVFALVIIGGGILGVLIAVVFLYPVRNLSPISIGIATLGALLVLLGLVGWVWGYNERALREPLGAVGGIRLGAFAINYNQILVVGVTAIAIAISFLILARTRVGVAMRAVASGKQTASLMGISVPMLRALAWGLGGACVALAAFLAAPFTYIGPDVFTNFSLVAIAAVVLGGLARPAGVLAGGLLFGIGTNLLAYYGLSNVTNSVTFLIVAGMLVLRPDGLFGRPENELAEVTIPGAQRASVNRLRAGLGRTLTFRSTPLRARTTPRRPINVSRQVKLGGWAGLAIVLIGFPLVSSTTITTLMAATLAIFIAVLGLNVLVGSSGQLSVGQGGFVAFGAYAAAVAAIHLGVPVLVGILILAPAAGGLLGFLIGLPAVRLSGLLLAILTVLFAFSMPEVATRLRGLTGGADGEALSLPVFLSGTRAQYWFALLLAVLAAGATVLLLRSKWGRRWGGVRDSEKGVRALGLSPSRAKLFAFTWCAALGGLSGAVSGALVGFITPQTYGVFLSVYLLVAVVIGGLGSIGGSFLGAVFIEIVNYYISASGSSIPPEVLFGLALILALWIAPAGLVGLARPVASALGSLARGRDLFRPRSEGGSVAGEETAPTDQAALRLPLTRTQGQLSSTASSAGHTEPTPVELRRDAGAGSLLELRGVSGGYGQVTVLRDISLQLREGEAVALLGANGAGKSTLLRLVSGLVHSTSGDILWRGASIAGMPPHAIAASGIAHVPEGRQVFPDLTVQENLIAGTFALGRVKATRQLTRRRMDEVLEYFPRLKDRRTQRGGSLSGGEQQMLAVARALMAEPKLIMLDEPSLGLAPAIVTSVFESLRAISLSGVAILVVEQNIHAAQLVADDACVLASGKVVMKRPMSEVVADNQVLESYLGVTVELPA